MIFSNGLSSSISISYWNWGYNRDAVFCVLSWVALFICSYCLSLAESILSFGISQIKNIYNLWNNLQWKGIEYMNQYKVRIKFFRSILQVLVYLICFRKKNKRDHKKNSSSSSSSRSIKKFIKEIRKRNKRRIKRKKKHHKPIQILLIWNQLQQIKSIKYN